ncbi:MAG: hypothetical protein J5710_00120 [Treponema sp.]|nr:hypothetical protein [Treponema sp.]
MTIKTRNRLNLSLFIFSLVFLAANIFIFLFTLYNKSFNLDFSRNITVSTKTNFLTRYNPIIVIVSLYFQIIYVCVTSFMLFRVFEKTQATDISYFFLFLIALIANSLRIWLPLFNMVSTYSNFLEFCGNCILFSKLLMPLSLLFAVVMGDVEQRQDLEKNIFLLLVGCIIFAQIIPLNTANICMNFEVDYSYRNVIRIASILVILATLVALFFQNKQRFYTQLTTLGLGLIISGTFVLFNSTNLLRLISSFVLLLFGDIFYLKELHKQYLWND